MNDPSEYRGGELALFRFAENWKRYLREQLRAFVAGRVLEVGAGIGSTTLALAHLPHGSWTCLEPDPRLATELRATLAQAALPTPPDVRVGTIASLAPGERFDVILYVDVLEHIEDDRAELARAAAQLSAGGRLIVLAPAHGFLFSPFDAAIGHHRRYTRATLAALMPAGSALVCSRYLDCVGVAASLANRALLRSPAPTLAQITLWDRAMVPLSRRVDRLLGYRVGKSVLAVFQAER